MLEFKSNRKYYFAEKVGRKPNTVREVEETDPRYKKLMELVEHTEFEWGLKEMIRIRLTENPELCFMRQIKHVCKFKGLFIISWRA